MCLNETRQDRATRRVESRCLAGLFGDFADGSNATISNPHVTRPLARGAFGHWEQRSPGDQDGVHEGEDLSGDPANASIADAERSRRGRAWLPRGTHLTGAL